MSALIKSGYDKLMAAGAFLLLAASLGWVGAHQSVIAALRSQAVAAELTGVAYTPSASRRLPALAITNPSGSTTTAPMGTSSGPESAAAPIASRMSCSSSRTVMA